MNCMIFLPLLSSNFQSDVNLRPERLTAMGGVSGAAGRNKARPRHPTRVPYQYHVTGGDVHVGRHGLLAPGGGAAASGGAGGHAVAELRGDAVEARVAQGLRALHALRGSDRHPLAAKLLGKGGGYDG